ncbi:MAG TPA: ROK family protein [Bryobacteraceae bacterium]|nr:ROK family protein [Bryobacteraceae bacterium]
MRKSRTFSELVFWRVFDHPYCQRGEIGDHFGVSAATVSRTLQTLLERQLVVESIGRQAAPGRQPRLLTVNPALAVLLGIEIDLDRVTAVATDMGGTLLGRGSMRYDAADGLKPMLEAAKRAAGVALNDAGVPATQVRHLGVGHPAILDSEGVCIYWANAPAWRHVPVRKGLEETFGMAVALDDRSRAHALGERHTSPEDARHPNSIYILAGTGIGMAIFLDGRLYRGVAHASGELGHTVIDPSGPICGCGNRGCVESFASIRSIIAFVAEGRARTQSVFSAVADPATITIDAISDAAGQGDALAGSAIQRAGNALGVGIANVVQVLNPSLVVLSGRLVRVTGTNLLNAVQQAVQKNCSELISRSVDVRIAKPKKDICAVGCALLAAEAAAVEVLRDRLVDQSDEAMLS